MQELLRGRAQPQALPLGGAGLVCRPLAAGLEGAVWSGTRGAVGRHASGRGPRAGRPPSGLCGLGRESAPLWVRRLGGYGSSTLGSRWERLLRGMFRGRGWTCHFQLMQLLMGRQPPRRSLTPLPPPKFDLLRTVPTPPRPVKEEESMASLLPTAWFRVSRGFFRVSESAPGLGGGDSRMVVGCRLPEVPPNPRASWGGERDRQAPRPYGMEEPHVPWLS